MKKIQIWKESTGGIGYRQDGEIKYSSQSLEWWEANELSELVTQGYQVSIHSVPPINA